MSVLRAPREPCCKNFCEEPYPREGTHPSQREVQSEGHQTNHFILRLLFHAHCSNHPLHHCTASAPVQVPSSSRQQTLPQLKQSNDIRHAVADDLVYMFLGLSLPTEKIDNPIFRNWLKKYTQVAGCIPVPSSNFPKDNVSRISENYQKVCGRSTFLYYFFRCWSDLGAPGEG